MRQGRDVTPMITEPYIVDMVRYIPDGRAFKGAAQKHVTDGANVWLCFWNHLKAFNNFGQQLPCRFGSAFRWKGLVEIAHEQCRQIISHKVMMAEETFKKTGMILPTDAILSSVRNVRAFPGNTDSNQAYITECVSSRNAGNKSS
ncbi:MAG: hypothetical protein MnENMB40S_18840 [Rhizobiaceae bacterium MnEN-MB40S]|nr:MAG: hypothetical protein MnENMB40S_18840 [Rhizobiaceae bacterium MnEN-MB40S]